MGIINRIEITSNLLTLASGHVPVTAGLRLIPLFFHRKKGVSKAQLKKLMMRRRRMFVDNVVMIHERRLHKKNFEDRIDRAKTKLINKPQKTLSKPSSAPKLDRSKSQSNQAKWQDRTRKIGQEYHKDAYKDTRTRGAQVTTTRSKGKDLWATRVKSNGSEKSI